ncbi:MAG: YlxR family protein [Deltaproteobacteria bacterium]|nr:YlxR family protein [Deltaproteobacteria bacterium]
MRAKPQRTCVVCRKRGAKEELWRFAFRRECLRSESAGLRCESSGLNTDLLKTAKLDRVGKCLGRGAYCHKKAECLFSPRAASSVISSLLRGSGREVSEDAKKTGNRALFKRLKGAHLSIRNLLEGDGDNEDLLMGCEKKAFRLGSVKSDGR